MKINKHKMKKIKEVRARTKEENTKIGIKEIPVELEELKKLIGKLKKLTFFHLDPILSEDNQLTELLSEGNQLTELPSGIDKFKNLSIYQ